jgi:hypothetical protein
MDPAQLPLPTSLPTTRPEVDPETVERLRHLVQTHWEQRPHDLAELLGDLAALPLWHGALLVVVGLLYLLLGWRVFKLLIILNAAVFGAMVGGALMVQVGWADWWWVGMLTGGALLGILAWPMMKFFVILFGGAVGASLGFAAFEHVVVLLDKPDWVSYGWVGAAVGAVLLGFLAAMLFRFGVMLLTAMQGSAMLLAGGVALAFHAGDTGERVREFLLLNEPAALLAVLGVGLAGLVAQGAAFGRHERRKAEVDAATSSPS